MGKFNRTDKTICPVASRSLFSDTMNNPCQNLTILSLVMVVTGRQKSRYQHWIDDVHWLLKPEFMQAGLMLREFHCHHNVESARVPGEFPTRSPWPLYVVRVLHEHDHMFIDRQGSANRRILELGLYQCVM